jgi:hypothetical protein
MKRRKRLLVVVATLATAAGAVLPGTAAARSNYYPAYNPAVAVSVSTDSTLTVDVVSWSDVSWAD